MKIVKESYESFVKREKDIVIASPLGQEIKNGKVSYYEILSDDNEYIDNFEVFDLDSNWLGIDVHSNITVFDDENVMKDVLSELKKYYTSLVLRISEEFSNRIELAKKYGFVENRVIEQGKYKYIELKIEF